MTEEENNLSAETNEKNTEAEIQVEQDEPKQEKETEQEIEDKKNTVQGGICASIFQKETFDQKEQEETERKEAGYYNCIFIDGKDFNTVINSGEIFGGLNQGSASEKNDKKEGNVFREHTDLDDFLKAHQNDGYACILLTLSVLKVVPEQYLFGFSEKLRKILSPVELAEGENVLVAYQSIEAILKIIMSERVDVTVNTAVGEIPIRGLILKDTKQIEIIKKTIWNNYPGMRDGLIYWLIEMSRESGVRKVLLGQIAEAIGEFASFDFTYAQNSIIPHFTDIRKKDNLYFLKNIMQTCLNSNDCGKFTDSLLENWCYTKKLWKVALSLYSSKTVRNFHAPLEKKIRDIIEWELSKGIEVETKDYEYIFENFSQIPFEILQENNQAAELYSRILSEVFQQCKNRKEKVRFGYYFCGLLFQDFLAEGYPFYRCALFNVFNTKEIRIGLSPVVTFVCEKKALRDIAANQIFTRYIHEMDIYSRSWEHEKNFLKSLAFTGRKADFQNLIHTLERKEVYGKTANEMKHYLEKLLEQRIGGR